MIPLIAVFIMIFMVSCGSNSNPQKDTDHSGDPITQDGPLPEPAQKKSSEAAENRNLVTGGFRGYAATNGLVNERFFRAEKPLALGSYLEDTNPNDILASFKPKLTDLLGTYEGDGLIHEMKNRMPNGVNLLLWYMAIDGLASDLSKTCLDEQGSLAFNQAELIPEAADLIKRLCSWPSPEVRQIPILRQLWDRGMQADAPESEFEEWSQFILGPEFTEASATAVRNMVVTMLFNPHFLIYK